MVRSAWDSFAALVAAFGDVVWWKFTGRSLRRRLLPRPPTPLPIWARVVQGAADWRIGILAVSMSLFAIAVVVAQVFRSLDQSISSTAESVWQVQAALLGFALALALYAMGLLGRYSSMAKSMPLVAGFPAVVNTGLGLLIATGLGVFLPANRTAASLTLTILIATGLWILLVGYVLRQSVRLHDPRERVFLRRWTIRSVIGNSVRRQAWTLYGMRWLEDHIAPLGATYEGLGPTAIPNDETRVVRSGRSGQLFDLNVYRLLWAIQRAADAGIAIEASLRPGQSATAASVFAVANQPIPQGVRMNLSRSVVMREQTGDSVDDEIDLLRRDASSAIDSDVGVLDAVLEVFTEIVEQWEFHERAYRGAGLE